MAQAKTCPHGGGVVPAHAPHLQAVYDKLEWPPVKPMVTRVEPHGGECPPCGQTSVAPVPVRMEPGTPVGASSAGRATSLRYTHAIRDARLSARLAQVYGVPSSEGALAHLCRRVNTRRAHRVAAILTRLRSRRLICRDATGARVHGRTPGEWGFQPAALCGPVLRPSRGHEGSHAVLGDHRPTIWVSDRYRAPKPHPAAPWHGCLAHQWRDGQVALEAGETGFAPRMKAVFLRACAIQTRRDT
jgi:transposase